MMRSAVCTAVLCLLACCYSPAQTQTSCDNRSYQPYSGEQLTNLTNSLITKLTALVDSDATTATSTINADKTIVTACNTLIQTKQSECIQCIDTICQAMVDMQGCTDVVASTATGGQCPLGQAVCDISNVVNKAVAEITSAAKAVSDFAKKTVGDIKKVATKVIAKIESGVVKAANEVKKAGEKVVSGITSTVNKIGSGLETVGGKIASGVEKAAKAVADIVNKGVNAVKDLIESIGRRRRQITEPTCADFRSNTNACQYYASMCPSCVSAFNIGGVEPTASGLVSAICSAAEQLAFVELEAATARLAKVTDVANNFFLYAAAFNTGTFNGGENPCIKIDIKLKEGNQTVFASQSVDPFGVTSLGELFAKDIYNMRLGP